MKNISIHTTKQSKWEKRTSQLFCFFEIKLIHDYKLNKNRVQRLIMRLAFLSLFFVVIFFNLFTEIPLISWRNTISRAKKSSFPVTVGLLKYRIPSNFLSNYRNPELKIGISRIPPYRTPPPHEQIPFNLLQTLA